MIGACHYTEPMKKLLTSFLDFLDRKTLCLIVGLGFLSFFFSIYLLVAFIVLLAVSTLAVWKYQGLYNERFKLFLKNYATFLFSFFLIILVIEGYLHFGRPEFLKLKEYSTLGEFSDFKDRGRFDEKIFHKDEKAFRILGLGDSFAENLTWEGHNYHDFLKKYLATQGYQNIDIINAGMSGTGPGYYYHVLEKLGDLLKPDLVIVGFFVGNDFGEMEFRYRSIGIYDIRQRVDYIERFLQLFHFKDWWLWQLTHRKYNIWKDQRNKSREVKQNITELQATFAEKTFLDIERVRLQIAEKSNKQTFTNSFNQHSGLISNFKKWCAYRKIGLVFVVFPDQYQVDSDLRSKIITQYNLKPGSLDVSYPNTLLTEYCHTNYINIIDLLPFFQQESSSKELYRKNDTHWNVEGNKLAAKIILDYLKDHNLIH